MQDSTDSIAPQAPLTIDAPDWQHIEAGVCQRMRLLEAVMADVYGPQAFLAQGLLPPALVYGHPGYLRPLHGVKPVGGTHLHIAAFDLARGPDGHWWVVAQRCQAPAGLGKLLENTYRALTNSLRNASPAGADTHIALLTPGPYNASYFEHASLARYLGLSLVEGRDLLVRDERLFLKTLQGLVPVHVLLTRVDDDYLDPLELRPDSTLGVPGLLQAIRAGHVLLANAPGSAFLESPALLDFLPALAQQALREELLLPALPTWWCGEVHALQEALVHLGERTIHPTYPGSPIHPGFDAVEGHTLGPDQLNDWARRIARHGDDYTVQARMAAGSHLLRVFAVSDASAGSDGRPRWRVVPGGLTRVADGSANVWALGTATLPAQPPAPQWVTRRTAENLYWLGRYTERAANSARLARLTLGALGGNTPDATPLRQWLHSMALANTLVLSGAPSAAQAPGEFAQALISSLGATHGATSVGYNLRALKMAAATLRERLSPTHWGAIAQAEDALFAHGTQLGTGTALAALQLLQSTSDQLEAITAEQDEHMLRDDGWLLLQIGRHVERLQFSAASLLRGLEAEAWRSEEGLDAMLTLFDRPPHVSLPPGSHIAALVERLVLDGGSPRSLAWVTRTLRGELAELAGTAAGDLGPLLSHLPDPQTWDLAALCATPAGSAVPPRLLDLLHALATTGFAVAEDIARTCFSHSGQANQSVSL